MSRLHIWVGFQLSAMVLVDQWERVWLWNPAQPPSHASAAQNSSPARGPVIAELRAITCGVEPVLKDVVGIGAVIATNAL
jgi:hypothetical protein